MKEHINEVKESINDVFESIATHEGKQTASFVHAIVSMKQIASGLDFITQIACYNAAPEHREMVENVYPTLKTIFTMAVSDFHKATNEEVDLNKCLDWAIKIDGQMDRSVDALRKKL